MTVALSDLKYLDVSDFYKKKYKSNANAFEEKDLIHYLQILSDAEQKLKYSALPELEMEILLLKLTHKPASAKLEEILAFIEKIKQEPRVVPKASNMASKKAEKIIPESSSPSGTENVKNLNTAQADGIKDFESLEGTLKGLKNLKNKGSSKSQTKAQDFTLNLSDIQANWSSIVEKVRLQKIALGSFLQEGIPYQTEGGKLIIAYDQNATFHQEHVEKNSRVIEEILNHEFKLPIKIGFRTIDFASEGIEIVPRTPEEVLKDIKNKEPIIKKIIDVFDLDESGKKHL
jgi:DNA polymerase III gamma/tau subunit